MMRQIVTATLLTALCSFPGVAGAEVGRDADTDIALLFDGHTTTESSYFCSSLPPGKLNEAAIWENNLWVLKCGAFSSLGTRAWSFVEQLTTNGQLAIYGVVGTAIVALWPVALSEVRIAWVRLVSICAL